LVPVVNTCPLEPWRAFSLGLPELKTQNGIADVGFGRMAWIIDPGGNRLAIVQNRH
jgi:hypothetical protein